MEYDVVAPIKPIFYKNYVDDTYVRRKKKNAKDQLFENINTYHDNIKLAMEVNPTKFLDTKITRYNSAIFAKFYRKSKNLLFIGVSRFPLDISTAKIG